MIFECKRCDEKFDDEKWIKNNQKEGFKNKLLAHIKQHDIHEKISYNFVMKEKR